MPRPEDGCKHGDRSNVNTHHESKTLYTCVLYIGYIQNHTWGIYPGITLQKTFSKLVITYVVYFRIRNYSMLCTPVATIPGVVYSIIILSRNLREFCTPVPQYQELL